MPQPLVSVIIPCFNGAKFLREAIDSAIGQSYGHQEVIVVDDGSTDDSASIMASYGAGIRVVRQPNAGLPAARNAGIHAAQGEYFAFLDADDYWDREFLRKLVDAVQMQHAAIAFCGWQNVGLPGPRGQPFIPPDYEVSGDKLVTFFASPRWPVHAALVRRDVIEYTGGFDPKWKSCEDFAFWIRVSPLFKLVRVAEVLAFYRFHGEQMTANRARMALSHFAVQADFLAMASDAAHRLGRGTRRQLMYGRLLEKGFEAYWARDLVAARAIFRVVMQAAYGSPREWLYMLPAWLPLSLHSRLIRLLENHEPRSAKKS